MIIRQVSLATLTLLVFSISAVGQEPASEAPLKLDAQVERILNWLPVDTETLIVAQQPWTVRDLESMMAELDPESMGAAEVKKMLGVMFNSLPVSFLLSGEVASAMEELDGKNVVLALEGSRAFAAPSGIGGGTFEGCQIVVVDAAATAALDRIIKRCEASAQRVVEHAGVKAFAIEQETEDEPITLFMCRPEEALLMCAADEAYLKETLDRRTQETPGDRALPKSLLEWKYVNTDAAVWGLRHYRETAGEKDRSSPRHAQPAIPLRDDKAIGFTFAFDPKSDAMASLIHVTSAEDAVDASMEAWGVVNPHAAPKVERIAPDAVRITLPVSDPYAAGNCWAMVMAYFGHVVNF